MADPPADSELTVAAFQRLIRERYEATDAERGAPGTFVWLIEEVGELATALQAANEQGADPQTRQNLEEEFADVIAWLTTLANVTGVDLTRALRKYTDPERVRGVKR